MYKIKRQSNYIDTLELENECGKTLKLDIKINITEKLNSFYKTFRAVELANIEISKGSKDYTLLGNAIIELLKIVFNEDNALKMIEFYDNEYHELIIDVFPFILNKVKPAFERAKKEREKQGKRNLKML